MLAAGELNRFQPFLGFNRLIAVRRQQIAEQLEVQVIIFDNENAFFHGPYRC